MADVNAKIYACQLVKGRYGELRQLSRVTPALVDGTNLHDALIESVVDQLLLASEFLSSAKNMLAASPQSSFEIGARNALSRAYYSIHHTVRATARFALQHDPYGHPQSIDAFIDVAHKQKPLGTRLTARYGDLTAASRRLKTILEDRHHADYDPYGASEVLEQPLDFQKAANEAIEDAEAVHS